MAYSPLGYSLPTLTITGYASPVASWGGPLSVTLDVINVGTSTINEPLALMPGATSSADAGPTVVTVYAVKSPRSDLGAVAVGTVIVPSVPQNTDVRVNATITLPQQPAGFPGYGGKVYLVFRGNSTNSVFETNYSRDVSAPVPLTIEPPLADLVASGLDLPPVMQPGDTVQPNIRITNVGPASTPVNVPVQVALIASTTPYVTSGSTFVALYTVPAATGTTAIPGESSVTTRGTALGDANLTPQANTVTVVGAPVTLPVSPGVYYVGVVIDPSGQVPQLSTLAQNKTPLSNYSLIRVVGPPIKYLPPAGVDVNGGPALVPTFPAPFLGSPVGGVVGGSFPTTAGTAITTPTFPIVPLGSLGVPATTTTTGTTTTTTTTTSTTTTGTTTAAAVTASKLHVKAAKVKPRKA